MEKKKFYKKWWFWVIVFLLLVGIFGNQEKTQNTTNTIDNKEKIVFLKNTNGKVFFKILCEVGNIKETEAIELGDSLMYETVNENYSIEVETNKQGEINYIRLMALQANDYTNFFLALSRLAYNGSNKETSFNWINDNLGKEAKTTIGDAIFELSKSETSGKPILEFYTEGNQEYQKQQIDKEAKK